MARSVGFIGGGRITRVLLEGWRRAGETPPRVVVSDVDAKAVDLVRTRFPGVTALASDNREATATDVVFLAVHPPAMKAVLAELRGHVPAGSLVVSLAPKLTMGEIAAALGGHARIARVIPNAPSIVGAGFNPVSFAPHLLGEDRQGLIALLAPLGRSPEVPEPDLEAYALITGMGPTYLWFQFYELLCRCSSPTVGQARSWTSGMSSTRSPTQAGTGATRPMLSTWSYPLSRASVSPDRRTPPAGT
jgi:pyrroline-5-carboxylate reductase